MPSYAFRLLNVFAESTFGGNPLCVFEDARGMDDATMQALALQFNLSETAFILPSGQASARIRVFTPASEMRFAGHPALGSAHVVRDLLDAGDALSLEFKAGVTPVSARGDVWTFTAPQAGEPEIAGVDAPDAQIASLLGLHAQDLLSAPLWVNTGADQLLVALRSTDAVRRARPDGARLDAWPANSLGRRTAYLFAFDPDRPQRVLSRYFVARPGGGIAEDPGTGSACANLGGWLLGGGHALPAAYDVDQGETVGRPCRLRLAVTADRGIQVGGRVIEIGRGAVAL